MITSVAYTQDWGAVCQGVRTGGRWTAEESQSHINMLELKAAFLAILSFLKEQEAVNVLVRLDNRTAIAYLNRMGSVTKQVTSTIQATIHNYTIHNKTDTKVQGPINT